MTYTLKIITVTSKINEAEINEEQRICVQGFRVRQRENEETSLSYSLKLKKKDE